MSDDKTKAPEGIRVDAGVYIKPGDYCAIFTGKHGAAVVVLRNGVQMGLGRPATEVWERLEGLKRPFSELEVDVHKKRILPMPPGKH